ncbi:PREDICTED: uncharacterized protein LOC102024926 [Chinchilla lanigera]|uniref:uncharacterized protein LOC102024926 n=1 Tax=Chinchilla lanigera TaxID=34839 RepID=UPI00038F141C|nr:PREDICTED: uncharacterized protein LOC102024926 [Chinchilla lanigera]
MTSKPGTRPSSTGRVVGCLGAQSTKVDTISRGENRGRLEHDSGCPVAFCSLDRPSWGLSFLPASAATERRATPCGDVESPGPAGAKSRAEAAATQGPGGAPAHRGRAQVEGVGYWMEDFLQEAPSRDDHQCPETSPVSCRIRTGAPVRPSVPHLGTAGRLRVEETRPERPFGPCRRPPGQGRPRLQEVAPGTPVQPQSGYPGCSGGPHSPEPGAAQQTVTAGAQKPHCKEEGKWVT